MKSLDKIEAAMIELLRTENKVFYASLLLQMIRTETPGIKTIGVTVNKGRIYLLYNPKFVDLLSLKELITVMEHEVLHLVLEHPFRIKDRTPVLWNIAADCATNQMLDGNSLPSGAITPDVLKLPKDKHAELYYDMLKKDAQMIKVTVYSTGNGNSGNKSGKCNNKNNNNNNNNGGDGGGNDKCWAEIETKEGKKIIIDNHDTWKEISENDKELKKEIVKHAIRQAYEETQKNRGYIPGEIQEIIDKWFKPPTISWKQLLKIYVGNIVKSEYSYTWKRVSRRFGDTQKGKMPERTLKLTVAIDTSGSVSKKEFQEFISEIKEIQQCYKSEILILECDSKIQKEYILEPYMQINTSFNGRGGTSYEPVFEYIKERNVETDLLIYFTDFYCTFPEKEPPYAVIWCVSSNGDEKNTPKFGHVVKISKCEEQEK